jgi:regulator of sirC expression with transglutaminase-like and TPR domain
MHDLLSTLSASGEMAFRQLVSHCNKCLRKTTRLVEDVLQKNNLVDGVRQVKDHLELVPATPSISSPRGSIYTSLWHQHESLGNIQY